MNLNKVKFGKTELMVSKVAFGGIPIMRVSKAEGIHLVQAAINFGINFFDTANAYADSEEKIGEAIRGIRREDIVISSKSYASDKNTFSEHIDLSLKRLGVDYLDIYQLHNLSSKEKRDAIFAPGGAMEALEKAVKVGKVRFIGFSSHSLPMAIEIIKGGRFASVQLPFNYIDNEAAEKAIPLAKELDIGFIAMKPMGGGLLVNAGLSFRFLGQYDSIVPDPGFERIEEVREIVSIVEKNEALSAEDKKEIEKLRVELGPSWCHRCDYCKPCPQDINISFVLSSKIVFKCMTLEKACVFAGPALEKARTCLECNVCVSRCPYNLDITVLLKENIALWDALRKKNRNLCF